MRAEVSFENKCRKLLLDFLKVCKANKPDIAVITPNGLIKDAFYLDLSEHVGKIILNTRNYNNELKATLLAHSGTVLEYKTEYNSTLNSVEILNMPIIRKNL